MIDLLKRAWAWGKRVVCAFLDTHCSMHAAGLTYYSLLAIVPLLCVLLLVAKTCGANQIAKEKIHEQFEIQVAQFEAAAGLKAAGTESAPPSTGPEAEAVPEEGAPAEPDRLAATREFVAQARAIESGLLERIDQFNVGTLGWIGLLMLVWTLVGSIGMVEVSFNEIWGVKRPRAVWRQIILYLFISIILPILSALALSVPLLKLVKDILVATLGSLWLTRWVSDGAIWVLDSWPIRLGIALFFTTMVFALLFKMLPNCKVAFRPAFWSGLVTAVLFAGWMKICAIAQIGIAKSSALYGSFAFLPIVLAWLYMSWQIVLFGCCLVYASSHSGDNPPSSF